MKHCRVLGREGKRGGKKAIDEYVVIY